MDFDDIVKIVDQVKVLEARLAEAEAEREKYQGLADNRLNCLALYRDLIGKHEARIGVLADKLNLAEAERDAATKKAEQLLLSRYFTRCREGAFDHSTDCATWGDDGQGNVDGKPVHPPCNCGASWNWAKQMEAERDAARAAGEKLRRLLDGYIASAISVRDKNTPEWMVGFVEDTNRTLEAIGDDDRVLLWEGNIYVKRLTNKGRQ